MENCDNELLERLSRFSTSYNEFVFHVEQLIDRDNIGTSFATSIDFSFVEWSVLCMLFIHGTMTMSKLARVTRLNPAHLSTIATNLENKGFVKRFQKENNRRTNYIELTQLGLMGKSHQLDCRIATEMELLNKNLSDEELDKLNEAYDYLNDIYFKIQQRLGDL